MSNVDERIHNALERVAGDVDDPVWESLVARRHRRRVQRGVLGAAAVLMGGVLATVGINSLMGPGDDTTRVVIADDPETAPPVGPVVSVVVEGVDGLSAESTPLSESTEGWLQHTITLRNDTAETVHVDDFRIWAWLGDEQALAATEGCAPSGTNLEVGCLADHRPVTLEPQAEHQFVITLWRDLPGMNAPADGPFEWRLGLSTSSLPFMPSSGGTPGTLVLTYDGLTQPWADEWPDGWTDPSDTLSERVDLVGFEDLARERLGDRFAGLWRTKAAPAPRVRTAAEMVDCQAVSCSSSDAEKFLALVGDDVPAEAIRIVTS